MKHDEKRLALFNTIMDSVSCGIIITFDDFTVRRLNRSAELITGWSEADAIGHHHREILRPLIAGAPSPLEETLARGHDHEERSITVRDKSGKDLNVRVNSHILREPDGEIFGAVQTFGDVSNLHELRMRHEQPYRFQEIISRNHRMRELFTLLPRLAKTSSMVLIRGESGVGKELFARAMHNLSTRYEGPFVAVNCAALPDNLLEAELFGSLRGAFTDAKTDRKGRVAIAEGGTLFLDEVGDISPAMQVKLLRFLQDRSYAPLGSSITSSADVRIVAATNRNLEAMIRDGVFREDFYYRLNVLVLEIPPLRERLEDIPVLVDDMLQRWASSTGTTKPKVTQMAMRALMSYPYPGNVRELENIIEAAAVMALDDQIDLASLPEGVRGQTRGEHKSSPATGASGSVLTPVEHAERDAIAKALADSGGNRQQAARLLGLSRTTLWRRIRKYGLEESSGMVS